MEAIPANAVTPINGYTGPCTLWLSNRYLSIKTDSLNELGTWPYESIRRFFTQDFNHFSFTSGRRGPFGVADYKLRMNEQDLILVQKTLTQYTGAQFDSPRIGTRTSSESSVSSNGSVSRSKTPANHGPPLGMHAGYSIMSVGTPTESHNDKFRPPPHNSPRLARHSTNKKNLDENRMSPFARQDSSSPVSFPDTVPSPTPTSPIVLSSRISSVGYPTSTPPRTPKTPNSHKYEDAEKFKGTPPLKLTGSTGNYDRLSQQNETITSRTPSPNTITDTNSSYASNITPNNTTAPYNGTPSTNTSPPVNSYETVEKRVKSPSPKATLETRSSPDSPPLTDTELSHLRHYNKEPLINISDTVHNRRHAEYIYIDLPDSSSDCTDSDSRPGSLYDIPTSNNPRNSYDIVPSPRPLLPPPPLSRQQGQDQSGNIYNTPRRESLSPLNRALPHLPTDYVNVMYNIDKTALLTEDLYSEIPNTKGIITKTNQQQSITNPNIDQNVPSLQNVEVPGQKLAQELAEEEGYILVNPAVLPAIVSPLPITDTPKLSPNGPLTMDDEYIEIRRTGPDILVPPTTPKSSLKHEYVNVPSSSSKRDSDGYEEVTELRKVCPLKTPTESHVTVNMDSLSLTSNEYATTRCLPHERQINNEVTDTRHEPLEMTLSSGSLKEEDTKHYNELSINNDLTTSFDQLPKPLTDVITKEHTDGSFEEDNSTINMTENLEDFTRSSEGTTECPESINDSEGKSLISPGEHSKDISQNEEGSESMITEPIKLPETFQEPLVEFKSSPENMNNIPENMSSVPPEHTNSVPEHINIISEDINDLSENVNNTFSEDMNNPLIEHMNSEPAHIDSDIEHMNSKLEHMNDTDDMIDSGNSLSINPPSSSNNEVNRTSYEHHIPNSIPVPQATLVPLAVGSPINTGTNNTHSLLLRKRSLTVGDPLDQRLDTKKHTYVNVPGDIPLSSSSSPKQSPSPPVYKKPMPLPRPQPTKLSFLAKSMSFQGTSTTTGTDKETHFQALTVNSNYNNNYCTSKVRTLIRQFSD